MLHKRSHNLHSKCQNTFWTALNYLLRFFPLDVTKKGQILFFTGKVAFIFSKKCVFNNLLDPDEMILDLRQWLSKKIVDPVNCYPRFVTLDSTRKNGKKSSFAGEQLYFEMFVSIDLLGTIEMILSFAQLSSKNIVHLYKKFPEVCHTR